jgi:hypothetical protein
MNIPEYILQKDISTVTQPKRGDALKDQVSLRLVMAGIRCVLQVLEELRRRSLCSGMVDIQADWEQLLFKRYRPGLQNPVQILAKSYLDGIKFFT